MVQTTDGLSWAFITPSYSGDFERCRLLCRSMDTFLSGNWRHYLVVDKPDLQLFKSFAGPRRDVLLTDDVLPGHMRRLFSIPFLRGRSFWWSKDLGPQIGWHLQQMVKIGMAFHVKADGLAYCDSDVFFIRPFSTQALCQGDRIRLYQFAPRRPLSTVKNPALFKPCLKLLGLPFEGTYHSYIENLITWRRLNVVALCEWLAERNKGSWQRAFRGRMAISEYNIYGLFVAEVLKGDNHHYVSDVEICKTQWAKRDQTDDDVAAFCSDLKDYEVAVGVQSFAGVDVKLLVRQFEKAAAAYSRKPALH